MTEPLGSPRHDAPSESLAHWLVALNLHRVTWLIVLAALLHLAGDVVYAVDDLTQFLTKHVTATGHDTTLPVVLAGIARTFGYSLVFFGTAATVEFLFRIWDELRLIRKETNRQS